jgi:hypothetical protein
MIVYIRQPETEKEKYGLIYSPFTPKLWLTVLMTTTILAVALYVTWNCGVKAQKGKIRESERNFVHSVLYVLGGLSMQG